MEGAINIHHSTRPELIKHCQNLRFKLKNDKNILNDLQGRIKELEQEIVGLNKIIDRNKFIIESTKVLDLVNAQPIKSLSSNCERVVEYLVDYYANRTRGITIERIRSKSRKQELCYVRKMICYMVTLYYGSMISSSNIAKLVGRDGSTCRAHVIEFRDVMDVNKTIATDVLKHINYINSNLV